ncbi:MAG: ribosome assembly cofactor RimP [Spirochaetaceae bacterium]|nr:ribosome assembly cofactor RimP [Spirochaetaceae bacterium]
MQYRLKEGEARDEGEAFAEQVKPIIEGLGLSLVGLNVSRHKGSVSVRAAVFKGGGGGVSIADCSKAHRALMPRLELLAGGENLSVEVSSPGISRLIKEGAEFKYFIGCPVKCWITGLSDWKDGILEDVTETYITIKGKTGMEKLALESIAKAKLNLQAAR